MFWNKKTIQLYRDAAEYCDFHQKLAAFITPYLTEDDSILDLGCGHGYIDLILAKHVKQITCIDNDKAVLTSLKSHAPPNITILHSAIENLAVIPHDYIMMSFFGRLTKDYDRLKKYAIKGIITIKNVQRTVIEMPNQKALKRETHGDIVAFCNEKQLDYQAATIELEFGQPFKTMADVYSYLNRYKPLNAGDYDDYIKNKLLTIDDTLYRYYLPKLKQIGIAIIKTKV